MSFRALLFALVALHAPLLRAQFQDDFSDGDLTNAPAWEGDAAVFIVNGNNELQLSNTVAATSQLRSANPMATLNDMEWRIKVRQNFAGSGSNFGRVYLVSDQADLTGPLNGYYLQFGEAGSADAIELFEQTGTTSASICRGTDAAIAGSFTAGIQVKRDASGTWQLLVDLTGGTNYVLQASGLGSAHTSSAFIGVRCTYTVSNAEGFFYDDIYAGPAIVDLTPPSLIGATAVAVDQVELVFSEAVDEATAEAIGNYALTPSIGVNSAIRNELDQARVLLFLASSLANGGSYTVTVNGVQDLTGNALVNGFANFSYLVPTTAGPRDVVINEFMADPTPVVGLPEVEYLELYNATADQTFDLAGWTFSDGGTPVTFPSYVMGPGAYVLVVTQANLGLFPAVANKIGMSSLPALNNDGDALSLRSNDGTLIDAVTYATSWYQDAVKDDGGWSLEQIDPSNPCSGASNWRASNAAVGGTPGSQNSVFAVIPDVTPPTFTAVLVPSTTSLVLRFSEPMDAASIASGTYTITPSVLVQSAVATGADAATLLLDGELTIGQVYTISISGLRDCPGNLIAAGSSRSFALPEVAEAGDLVINEVLYDPFVDGVDFVELYNRSDKTLSLASTQLANAGIGGLGSVLPITTDLLLLPGDYAVITTDLAATLRFYPQTRTDRVVVNSMPSYNNGEGTVLLLTSEGDTLDLFSYSDDLHFGLINQPEGYTLERVDPDRPADDATNWQTASEQAGKATPGFRNSQFAEAPAPTGELTIEPGIFSPDNDGFQDLLTLSYRFEQPGFVGSITIFDIAGRAVRALVQSQLLGVEGAYSWDGLTDEGSKARMGPYIVVLEAFDLSGNVETFRRTVTLAHRLE